MGKRLRLLGHDAAVDAPLGAQRAQDPEALPRAGQPARPVQRRPVRQPPAAGRQRAALARPRRRAVGPGGARRLGRRMACEAGGGGSGGGGAQGGKGGLRVEAAAAARGIELAVGADGGEHALDIVLEPAGYGPRAACRDERRFEFVVIVVVVFVVGGVVVHRVDQGGR